MAERIVNRKDTAANWATANPVLAEGEFGFETDTRKWKVGNGATTWNSMPYGIESNDVNHIAKHNWGLEIEGAHTAPTPTVVDSIILYNKSRAGRPCPIWKDDLGETYSIQPAFFGRSISVLSPGNNTTLTQQGCLFTSTGTVSHPVMTAATLMNSVKMARWTSAAATNSSAGVFHPSTLVWRGTPGGIGPMPVGGFFMYARFGLSTVAAGSRCFIGLSSQITTLAGEPSALPDCWGIGWDSTDTAANMFLYRRSATGAVQKIEISVANGFSFDAPRSALNMYDFYLYAPPGGSDITVRLVNETTDLGCINNVIYIADMPASATFLSPMAMVNSGTLATAHTFDVSRLYIESDF